MNLRIHTGMLPEKWTEHFENTTEIELKFLLALLLSPEYTQNFKSHRKELADKLHADASEIDAALAFWRGTGILSLTRERVRSSSGEPVPADDRSHAEPIDREGIVSVADTILSSAAKSKGENTASSEPPKRAVKETRGGNCTASQIAQMMEENTELRSMIDICQQTVGKIFSPAEVGRILYLYRELALECEFLVMLFAYCKKLGKANVAYVERVAIDLFNEGIADVPELDRRLKAQEMSADLSHTVRYLLGIGERAFSQKEQATLLTWAADYGYDTEMITYCYEIMIHTPSLKKPSIAYMNGILSNWYQTGIRNKKEAVAYTEKTQEGKHTVKEEGQTGSFDTDEFFNLALQRSYANMDAEISANRS